MSKNLSQIVSDLFATPPEGRELSAQIQRLGLEIKLVVQSEDTIFGRFRGLLDSFREIIPDEQQRYEAAIKALSTTAKMDRQEIGKALKAQAEELKIIEKSVLPFLSGWRDELKTMEARSKGIKSEIANLRARIAQLEGEEKTVQTAKAARERDLEVAEKTIRQLFTDIGAEITAVSRQMEGLPPEGSAVPPVPAAKSATAEKAAPKKEPKKEVAEKKTTEEQKIEIEATPAPVDSRFQRKCPMCGGPFNLLQLENIWQCYTCAYEEPNK